MADAWKIETRIRNRNTHFKICGSERNRSNISGTIVIFCCFFCVFCADVTKRWMKIHKKFRHNARLRLPSFYVVHFRSNKHKLFEGELCVEESSMKNFHLLFRDGQITGMAESLVNLIRFYCIFMGDVFFLRLLSIL